MRTLVPAGGESQCALPLPARGGEQGSVTALFARAEHGLAVARREIEPAARFATAYRGAQRAAAAVLVARGSPHRARRRPQSVWVLLQRAAPELAEWAGYFAALSDTYAAAQAGRTRRVAEPAAGDILAGTELFLADARQVVEEADDV